MNKTDHVVVIGGGVIGAMAAWYLSKSGRKVTIVDRDSYGAACSHGNCGYISPSHVLPLSRPGAIGKTLKTMLKPNSPFAIKPRMSLAMMSWFFNFMKKCNEPDMLASGVARNALLQSSKKLYQQLVKEEKIDCEWQEAGLLLVYKEEKELDAFRETNDLIVQHFGQELNAIPYDADKLLEVEPALKPDVAAGAWFYPGDCHIRPDKLLSGIRSRLESDKVSFVDSFSVEFFVNESGQAVAISDGQQSIEADSFVVATGAMTPFLNQHLGCNIPIQPGKGYSLTMPTPEFMPQIPIIFEDSHVAITPMKTKYRIGSTMEFVGYDTTIRPKRLRLLREAAVHFLKDPMCDPIEEKWFGWRPMTYDGMPIIDRSPAIGNVWIAAGHNMTGLSMATATGKLVSELLLGEDPHIDAKPFSVSRFHN
ncbi:MAG: FAD-dependent oxidoreductase [Planctomycetota bacterium]